MVELKSKTTEEIIFELRQGSNREVNYELLFERYHDQVHRFFQRKGLSREDCLDLTQDVFMAVHRGLQGLRDETQFHTWLFKIVRNTFRNELERRQAKKRAGRTLSLEERPEKSESKGIDRKSMDLKISPMDALLQKERREKLADAIKNLPPQMQRCVKLRVLKGLSIAEIAVVMRISENTAKAHLHQARKALKEDIGQHFTMNEI
jgi:RNA polymerase sigma-70 factor, ECF subfamily